jgi:hypothetical protein
MTTPSPETRLFYLSVGAVALAGLLTMTGCGDGDDDGGGGGTVNVPTDQDTGGGGAADTAGGEEPDTTEATDTGSVIDTQMSGQGDGQDGPDGDATGDTSMSSMDGGDAGEDADGVVSCGGQVCGQGESCYMDQCVPNKQVKCNNAQDLGTLQLNKTTQISDSFAGYTEDFMKTQCAGGDQNPEKVYKFTVATHSQIDFEASFSGFDAKLEFRQDQCLGDPGEYGSCRDSNGTFFAPAGTNFYLVVEQDVGVGGDFTIDLTAKPSCSFGAYGEYGCKMGNRYLCEKVNQQPKEKKFVCPAGCTGGECTGGSCSNPIVIQAQQGFSKTYSGSLEAYTSNMNFKNANMTCSVQTQKPNSLGPEVIFKVQGVKQGQTIKVDTNADSNANLTYITNNCSGTVSGVTCAATGQETASMTAQTAGDYFIYIDKYTSSTNPFDYEIRIE